MKRQSPFLIDEIAREFVAFPGVPRPNALTFAGTLILALGSAIKAATRLRLGPSSVHRQNHTTEAWTFARAETEVLDLIAEARASITLIEATELTACWPPAQLAWARLNAALRLTGAVLRRPRVLGGLGRATPCVVTALAEHQLHLRRLRCGGTLTIVVANDHSPRQRALLFAARAARIATVYVQHAAVGGFESPIIADRNLVHGVDAARKYLSQGGDGRLYVLGLLKSTKVRELRHGSLPREVGVCPGLHDNLDALAVQVAETLLPMARAAQVRLVLRPHPRDGRVTLWRDLCDAQGLLFSDSRSESTVAFLARVRWLVGGDSHISIEALAGGCPAYLLPSPRPFGEQYGVIAAGLLRPLPATPEQPPPLDPEVMAAYAHDAGLGFTRLAALHADLCEGHMDGLAGRFSSHGPDGEIQVLRREEKASR